MNESMLCTKTHEYVLEQDGKYEIGITDYAIEQLGDIVLLNFLKLEVNLLKMKHLQQLNL